MIQKWNKRGLIYKCRHESALPHYAAVPFAEHLSEDTFRIYYSGRNKSNQSIVSFFDFDLVKSKIIQDNYPILLEAGSAGCFDDAGTVLFQIVNKDGNKWLFYSGWSLEVKVPFRFNIGLAKKDHDYQAFVRFSEGPIVGQTIFDPFMSGAPTVLFEDGVWKMWYVSCVKWSTNFDPPKHYYLIKYTESTDGVNWFNERKTAIDFKDETEFAIARPFVIKENGIFKMWYSYRGKYYKIGYAESSDGVQWVRKDHVVDLPLSRSGWDSEMICYGFIFDHIDKRYMLYNGNGYGKSGIGLAVLEKS